MLGFGAILLLATLSLDTLAVSISLGLSTALDRREQLRIAVVFAAFEGGMPIIGLLLGDALAPIVGRVAGVLAGAALLLVGVLMLREALEQENDAPSSRLSWPRLLLAGLGISLDEVAMGFVLGLLRTPPAAVVGYLAIQAFVLTLVGLITGRKLGQAFSHHLTMASGILLVILGVAAAAQAGLSLVG